MRTLKKRVIFLAVIFVLFIGAVFYSTVIYGADEKYAQKPPGGVKGTLEDEMKELEKEVPTEEEIKEKAKGEEEAVAPPKSLLQVIQDKFRDMLFTR